MIGVDTGFFFALEELHPTAVEIWENTRDPHFELYKKKEIKIINLKKS